MSETNYSRAWLLYKRTGVYRKSSEAMKKAGIKQPYRNNILQSSFAAGWGNKKIYLINQPPNTESI